MHISNDTIYIESATELMSIAFSVAAQFPDTMESRLPDETIRYIALDNPIRSERFGLIWGINASGDNSMKLIDEAWNGFRGFFGIISFSKTIKKKYNVDDVVVAFDITKTYTEGDSEFELFMTFMNAVSI